MRRVNRVLIVVVFVLAADVGIGEAVTITGSTSKLSTGSASVSACATLTGSQATFATDDSGNVTSVTFAAIPSACNGGSAVVTLTNGTTSVSTGGPTAIAGGSATITVGAVAVTQVTNVYLAISGP